MVSSPPRLTPSRLPSDSALPSSGFDLVAVHRFALTPFLSHSSALFCTLQNDNSLRISGLRTLCAKHPGWVPAARSSLASGNRRGTATGGWLITPSSGVLAAQLRLQPQRLHTVAHSFRHPRVGTTQQSQITIHPPWLTHKTPQLQSTQAATAKSLYTPGHTPPRHSLLATPHIMCAPLQETTP
jgi:hypothetical protein